MDIYRNILISLSLLMYFPVAIAFYGVISYINIGETDIEYLFGSAYMVIFSSIIWIPYITMVIIKWKKLTNKIKLFTSIPFLSMITIALYIDSKGMPW